MAAMLTVLNKRWISQGWRAMDKEDAEPMALVFIEALDRESVPWRYYDELYQRACQLRASRIAQGLKADEFSVDLMVVCWSGLQKELREREIAAGRTLTGYAQSQCMDCYGTGIKIVRDVDGRKIGARPGCTHERIDPSERDMAGFEKCEQALRQPTPEETAVDICKRVSRQLHYELITAIDTLTEQKAWEASRTWAHAEKYCRENP
jgi:hypothetical protein